MSLYVQRVITFLYAESRRHFYNLTDMCWKPSACFGLRVGMVPNAYQQLALSLSIVGNGKLGGHTV
jgi:hypothetical protein